MSSLRTAVIVWSTLVAATASAQTPASAACSGREVRFDCSNGACELVVEIVGKPGCRLRIDDDWLKTQNRQRITEETALRLRIVGANLLKYGLKFETKEKVVDSYVDLEKLWRQALSVAPFLRAGVPAPETFVEAIKAWRAELEMHDTAVSKFAAGFRDLVLRCAEREAIRAESEKVRERLADLEVARETAAKLIERSEDFAVYDKTLERHEATVARLRSFAVRGSSAADGVVERVTFGPAGRIVTVTITMTDLATGKDAGVTEVVEFFVHSTLPVTFHAGYSYSSLDSFEFERVAAAAGEDLFAQINEGKNTSGFTAFLSYRLGRAHAAPGRRELMVTLGTDFAEPGKRIFVGATTRVKKVLLTGGIATAAVREAGDNDKITDIIANVGEVLGTRELFTRIQTTRQWRPFVAITFAPF
jgi:hypothetical protein